MTNHFYNKNLREYARENRNNSTQAEIYLWKNALRASKMGVPFRRQRPIDRFIADFACLPLKLIIEVDGATHNEPDVKRYDSYRQKRLEFLGFTVIRFTNDEVFHQLDRVKTEISEKISELQANP